MPCTEIKKKFPEIDECFSGSTSVSENKKKFRLVTSNRNDVCCIKVDGCLIKSKTTKKCDYLLLSKSLGEYYFVELKGTDIFQAYAQIIETIRFIKTKITVPKDKILGFVVSEAVPRSMEQQFRKKQLEFRRDFGKSLTKQHRVCEYKTG